MIHGAPRSKIKVNEWEGPQIWSTFTHIFICKTCIIMHPIIIHEWYWIIHTYLSPASTRDRLGRMSMREALLVPEWRNYSDITPFACLARLLCKYTIPIAHRRILQYTETSWVSFIRFVCAIYTTLCISHIERRVFNDTSGYPTSIRCRYI